MTGYVHSIESFGTVDGPGIRFVIFLQGCPMRCLYCHNPDTWQPGIGKQMSAEELLTAYKKNQIFYKNGGITVTGGEPLVQMDFLIHLFTLAKDNGIHTCLDTSGITFQMNNPKVVKQFDILMQVTDLVLLDIKHINPGEHEKLTGQKIDNVLAFAKYLEEKKIPLWIRHVVIPTITYNEKYLKKLGYYLGGLTNIKTIEVLPYHSMGKSKYVELGLDYPLKDIEDMDKEENNKARAILLEGFKKKRSEHL